MATLGDEVEQQDPSIFRTFQSLQSSFSGRENSSTKYLQTNACTLNRLKLVTNFTYKLKNHVQERTVSRDETGPF